MTCKGYCDNYDGESEDGKSFYCYGYHQWLKEGSEDPYKCDRNPDNK